MIIEEIDKEKAVEIGVGKYESWKDARIKKEEIWSDIISAYLTEVDDSKYNDWPWRSRTADTFIQETGDSISSALRNALFPINDEYYRIEGIDEIGKMFEIDMKVYMDSLLQKSNFIEKTKPFWKQMALLGNAPAMIPWTVATREKRSRGRILDKDGKPQIGITRTEETLYDAFDFETLDALDVVGDPSKLSWRDTPIIRRTMITKAQLDEMSDLFDGADLSSLEEAKKPSSEKTDNDKRKRARLFGLEYEQSPEDIELLIIETGLAGLEIDGKIYYDYTIVIGNRNILLRFEENEYWGGSPLIWGTYDNLWFTPYGKGAIEPILGTYHLINTFTNQKADILNLIINGCFTYVDDGIIDPENAILRPGGLIEQGMVDNLKPIHPNTNVSLAFTEIESLRARGDRSSGSSDYTKGVVPKGKRTAFESNQIAQGSSSRFNDVIKHQSDGVLEYVLQHYLEQIKQFKFRSGEIDDKALFGQYRVTYLGADLSAVKSFDIQQFAMFMQQVGQNPVFAQAINPTEAIQEWRRLLNVRNKNLVLTPEQMEANQRRNADLANQGKGGGSGQGGSQGLVNPDNGVTG